MNRLKYAYVALIGLATAFPACGGGDDDDDDDDGGSGGTTSSGGTSNGKGTGGSSSGKGGSGGSSSGKGGTGGTSSGSGGTGGGSVECADGGVSYYDLWYGNEACAHYFDCYFDYVCGLQGANEAACREQINVSLSSLYCYPEGTALPDDATLTVACNQARQSIAATATTCAD